MTINFSLPVDPEHPRQYIDKPETAMVGAILKALYPNAGFSSLSMGYATDDEGKVWFMVSAEPVAEE